MFVTKWPNILLRKLVATKGIYGYFFLFSVMYSNVPTFFNVEKTIC